MRIGVMGVHYGHIGGMFQSAIKADEGEIVGLVEADDALFERYTQEHAVPRYESLEEMLTEARPELVLEGVTHPEKVGLIEACADAGVHVLLDKPLVVAAMRYLVVLAFEMIPALDVVGSPCRCRHPHNLVRVALGNEPTIGNDHDL